MRRRAWSSPVFANSVKCVVHIDSRKENGGDQRKESRRVEAVAEATHTKEGNRKSKKQSTNKEGARRAAVRKTIAEKGNK